MPTTHLKVVGVDAVAIENAFVKIVCLVGKGADVYSIVCKRTEVDPLWKSHWGPEHLAAGLHPEGSDDNWFARCPGGWQTLVPSGGAEPLVAGAIQPQHGEASVVRWRVESVAEQPDGDVVRVSCRLIRSPFRIERTLHLPG